MSDRETGYEFFSTADEDLLIAVYDEINEYLPTRFPEEVSIWLVYPAEGTMEYTLYTRSNKRAEYLEGLAEGIALILRDKGLVG